jgi:hypothetical protein
MEEAHKRIHGGGFAAAVVGGERGATPDNSEIWR